MLRENCHVCNKNASLQKSHRLFIPLLSSLSASPGGIISYPRVGYYFLRFLFRWLRRGIQAIGCGEYHSLIVLRQDADVYSCGLNSYGQLGLGDTKGRNRLNLVPELVVSKDTVRRTMGR